MDFNLLTLKSKMSSRGGLGIKILVESQTTSYLSLCVLNFLKPQFDLGVCSMYSYFFSLFHSLPCTQICIVREEISNVADIAARLYHEATPDDCRSAPEIWDTMTKTQDRLIKTIQSQNFKKYISIAHKDNGEDFFLEVPTLHVFFFILVLCSL